MRLGVVDVSYCEFTDTSVQGWAQIDSNHFKSNQIKGPPKSAQIKSNNDSQKSLQIKSNNGLSKIASDQIKFWCDLAIQIKYPQVGNHCIHRNFQGFPIAPAQAMNQKRPRGASQMAPIARSLRDRSTNMIFARLRGSQIAKGEPLTMRDRGVADGQVRIFILFWFPIFLK